MRPIKTHLRFITSLKTATITLIYMLAIFAYFTNLYCKYEIGDTLLQFVFVAIGAVALLYMCIRYELTNRRLRKMLLEDAGFITKKSKEYEQQIATLEDEKLLIEKDNLEWQEQIHNMSVTVTSTKQRLDFIKLKYQKMAEDWSTLNESIKAKDKLNDKLIAQLKEKERECALAEENTTSIIKSIEKKHKDSLRAQKKENAYLQEVVSRLSNSAYTIEEDSQKYWKHYKGGVYRQIAVAHNTDTTKETGTDMIIYASLINGEVYARSYAKFHSSISAKSAKALGIKFKVGDTLPPRFEEISKEEACKLAAEWASKNRQQSADKETENNSGGNDGESNE